MSLHCYVIPQALASHATHVVRHIARASGIGRRAVAHPPIGAVPHMAPVAVPPTSCSAPVQALRAMRALAGKPAAALVAGGMVLGGAGAGLAGAGAPAGQYAAGSAGGAGFAGAPGSTGPTSTTAARQFVATSSGTGSTIAVQNSIDNTPNTFGPVATPSVLLVNTPNTPTLSTPVPFAVPDITPAVMPPPVLRTPRTDAPQPTPVPEPAGLAWVGLLAAAGTGLALRRRPGLPQQS